MLSFKCYLLSFASDENISQNGLRYLRERKTRINNIKLSKLFRDVQKVKSRKLKVQ